MRTPPAGDTVDGSAAADADTISISSSRYVCTDNIYFGGNGEVWLGGGPVEALAPGDAVLALGGVFHECLTLRRCDAEGEPPTALLQAIPSELAAVAQGMLAPAAADRYGSAAELAAALAPLCATLDGNAAALARALVDLKSALPRPIVAASDPEETLMLDRGPTGALGRAAIGSLGHASTLPAKRATGSGSRSQPRPIDRDGVDGVDGTWRWRWLMTLAAAIFAFAASAAYRRSQRAPSAPPPPPLASPRQQSSVPAAAPPPAAPPPVRLRVQGPVGAHATVDDEPIGALPLDVSLPRADRTRQLVVTQPGRQSWSRTIAGNVDIALDVALERATRGAPASPIRGPLGE
jgi:hypothetical protein